MFRGIVLLSAALLAATPGLTPAGELAPRQEIAVGKVRVADLDLSTSAGTAAAHRRLTTMAERLCQKFRDQLSAADWATYVDCVHDTVASALEQIQTEASNIAKN